MAMPLRKLELLRAIFGFGNSVEIVQRPLHEDMRRQKNVYEYLEDISVTRDSKE